MTAPRPEAGEYILVRFGPESVQRLRVSSNDTVCRSCKLPILWVVTQRGRANPVDVAAAVDGTRVSHFVTCPQAAEWRGTTRRGRR